jgi:hypothetical protein
MCMRILQMQAIQYQRAFLPGPTWQCVLRLGAACTLTCGTSKRPALQDHLRSSAPITGRTKYEP